MHIHLHKNICEAILFGAAYSTPYTHRGGLNMVITKVIGDFGLPQHYEERLMEGEYHE
jgi:hypothetical protein